MLLAKMLVTMYHGLILSTKLEDQRQQYRNCVLSARGRIRKILNYLQRLTLYKMLCCHVLVQLGRFGEIGDTGSLSTTMQKDNRAIYKGFLQDTGLLSSVAIPISGLKSLQRLN